MQVSMPDGDEGWKGMEAILDKKMPQHFWSDWRRWLLLILLLLLLIGVCNCPGRGRLFHGSETITSRAYVPGGHANPPMPATTATITRHGATTSHPALLTPADTSRTVRISRAVHPSRAIHSSRVAHSSRAAHPSRADLFSHKGKSTTGHRTHRTAKDPTEFGDITEAGPGNAPKNLETTAGKNIPAGPDTTARKNNPAGLDTTTRNTVSHGDSAKKNAPSLPTPTPRKDSSRKKPPAPPQEPKQKDHGWVFGVGLNEFFPVGGQNGSTYNSNGLTGTLSDYLPVPMIRYYLNHKAYLQVEAQFNTPQPTPKNLVISQPAVDTSTRSGIFTQISSSASIQQLYYFNIPFSIHFNPWDNLDIGTGLQWSHLTNAIGQFDSSTSTSVNGNIPTVVDAKSTHSFKGDTLYRRIKTNEFRILLDVNYTYKHWVLGLRYNQALSKFVNLQLPTGGTTQATNSSLQLYLRYILWDTRKKKLAKTP